MFLKNHINKKSKEKQNAQKAAFQASCVREQQLVDLIVAVAVFRLLNLDSPPISFFNLHSLINCLHPIHINVYVVYFFLSIIFIPHKINYTFIRLTFLH